MVESCRYFVGKTEGRIKKKAMCTKPENITKDRNQNTNKLHITNMERIKKTKSQTGKEKRKEDFFLHELCIFSTTTMYYYNFYYYYYYTALCSIHMPDWMAASSAS